MDQLTDEMNKDNKEDWYASFPEDMVIFELGKLSSNNFDGNGEVLFCQLSSLLTYPT